MQRNHLVLVTGATGFIGGRLVEKLAAQGVRIRIATSDFRHCARVARFQIEMVKADLLDHAALSRAVAGCAVVFHFAYRFGGSVQEQRRANLDGTRALAEAALEHGARRFVHISSVSAYGAPVDGDLSEATPPRATRDDYSDTKQQIEQMLQDLRRTRGLPLTILQPTIVYGPYGSTWTTRLLDEVRSHRVLLPARGLGLCNAVYVDDVATAALLAAECEAAVGERFLISGPAPVTWREFYGAYEKMLRRDAVLAVDDALFHVEARRQRKLQSLSYELYSKLARRPSLRRRLLRLPPQCWLLAVGRAILPTAMQVKLTRHYEAFWYLPPDNRPSLLVPDVGIGKLYAARTHVRIDKARGILGYTPAFDLAKGMALTEEWARWANLLTT